MRTLPVPTTGGTTITDKVICLLPGTLLVWLLYDLAVAAGCFPGQPLITHRIMQMSVRYPIIKPS